MAATVHLPERAYVAVPLHVTLEELPRVVGGAFDQVAALLARHAVPVRGAVIRYVSALADGTFTIEVGHLVDPADLEGGPLVAAPPVIDRRSR